MADEMNMNLYPSTSFLKREYTKKDVNKVADKVPIPFSKFNLAIVPARFSIVVASPTNDNQAGVIIAFAVDCMERRSTYCLGVKTYNIGIKIEK
jgi:hypothetical protein